MASGAPLKTPNYNKITTSRAYPDVNTHNEASDDVFSSYEIRFDDIERFEVVKPIGSGKYSIVFLGRADKSRLCAVKTLKNVPFIKIQREILLLSMVADIPYTISLIAVVRDPLTATISIVTDYLDSEMPKTLYPKLGIDEIRILMFKLLTALNIAHSRGIMHRDVKPGNILISKQKTDLKLIDWGLADSYFPCKAYNVRVATLRYKAPELLLNYQYYDYGVDLWGAGCVLAEMLIRFPFFEGRTIDDMILEVASVCGSMAILQYADKYGLNIPGETRQKLPSGTGTGWIRVLQDLKAHKNDDGAIHLMKKLLTVDHAERITAAEALQHPFFNPIRNQFSHSV